MQETCAKCSAVFTTCTCDKTYYEKHGEGDPRDTTIMKPPFRGIGYSGAVPIDNCLVREIRHLWGEGIITIACCCGHGFQRGAYIYVTQACERKMLALKYRLRADIDDYNVMCVFVPKTIQG